MAELAASSLHNWNVVSSNPAGSILIDSKDIPSRDKWSQTSIGVVQEPLIEPGFRALYYAHNEPYYKKSLGRGTQLTKPSTHVWI